MDPFIQQTFKNRNGHLRSTPEAAPAVARPTTALKNAVWMYFLLLVLEGALRKWFLPSLSTPLLIIRDPLALWIVLVAWKQGFLQFNMLMFLMTLIGIIAIYTAVFLGHGNIYVALYGARIMLFHFPLIFAVGKIFNYEDVIRLGKVLLWMTIPMTLLIGIQFYSPQSAWVNRGVGGDINGAGFSGAMDFFRPPGTFSFTNGTSLFYGLVASFVFYFWIVPKGINRLLLIAATVCLFIAIPLSISRSLFFQNVIAFLFAGVVISHRPRYLGKMLVISCVLILALVLLGKVGFFQTAVEAFNQRFETANEQEGGLQGVLGGRYLGGLLSAISKALQQPFWGYGLGMGTNVGSVLLTGEQTYLISEEEWARVLGELGPLLGLAVIIIRMLLSLRLGILSYRHLLKGSFLPWMLLSFALLNVPQGQWSQPTSLGFSILVSGLLLASLNRNPV